MAQREIMWKRFGYDVYQISHGIKSGKGYVIELGQEMSKTTSTASSAIEVR
jgi:hypothetical protein